MDFASFINPVNLYSDPEFGSNGDLYFNSASGLYRYFTSGSWLNLLTSKTHVSNVVENIYSVGSPSLAYLSYSPTENQLVGGVLLVDTASACLIMIPDASSENVHIGSSFTVVRTGLGTVGVIGNGSTTILKPSNIYLTSRYSSIKLLKIGEELWSMSGEFPDIY